MGAVKPVFFLLTTQLLYTGLIYCVNLAFDHIPAQFKLAGTLGAIFAAYTVLHSYAALFRPSHVSKFTYNMVVFFFAMTCFDVTTVVDFQLRPNTIFLTHYVNCKDPFIDNAWTTAAVYLDAGVPYLFNLIIFYRMFNGLSWRSLEIFNSAVWFAMIPPYLYPILTPQAAQYADKMIISKLYYSVLPIISLMAVTALSQTRQNNLGAGSKAGKGAKQSTAGFFASGLFKLVNFTLTLVTIGLIAYECLVALDLENIHPSLNLNATLKLNLKEDYLRKNSPVLFFQPVQNLVEFAVVNLYMYIVVVLPTLVLNLVVAFRRFGPLPSFLWDLNVFNAGLLFLGQGYLLVAPFLPMTPTAYKVNPVNVEFWAINLLPVFTALVNVLALTPFRKSVAKSKPAGINVEGKKRR